MAKHLADFIERGAAAQHARRQTVPEEMGPLSG
jgi:hypothetical protein